MLSFLRYIIISFGTDAIIMRHKLSRVGAKALQNAVVCCYFMCFCEGESVADGEGGQGAMASLAL